MLKDAIKKFIPEFIVNWYHFSIAFLAALFYGFPSRKMIVIGVTGTKGKTTAANLICHLLNESGFKAGLASTVNFRIGNHVWTNKTRQTMLGRFALQKLLADMVKQGCKYAVVETSSEGILQYRHRFIDYDIAVFLNLMPEHLDRHGGIDNYRAEKLKLFKLVSKKKNGIGVYNLDDKNASYFIDIPIQKKYGYTIQNDSEQQGLNDTFVINDIQLFQDKTIFKLNNKDFETKLIGDFNVANTVAAITTVFSLGVKLDTIATSLKSANLPPGRMEIIQKEPFLLIVDYAYEPNGLAFVLKALKSWQKKRLLVMTGIAAGDRDRWQRSAMGEVAAQYANIIVATTDDPYEEDPVSIINEVISGALKDTQFILGKNVFSVVDRREAIGMIISLAEPGDIVLLAGKGGETAMKVAGKKIPWDESEVAREALAKLKDK